MKKIAIAVAAVTASALMTCGCSSKSSKSKNKGVPEKPTEWAVEQRSAEDILPLEGETQAFIKRDEENDDILILAQGVLADRIINNEYDALDLIAEYSKELGIVDAYSELKFSGTLTYSDMMSYKFDQYCNGVKVSGSGIDLTVDMLEGNSPEVLSSTYSDLWGFETKPRVSSDEAVKCAKDKYKTSKETSPELLIIDGSRLAWRVPVNDEKIAEVYISAENGDIISETAV